MFEIEKVKTGRKHCICCYKEFEGDEEYEVTIGSKCRRYIFNICSKCIEEMKEVIKEVK